jgi:predicted transcriptional regulator
MTRIIKKHHLIKHAAENAIVELMNHNLVEETDKGYKLTDLGMKTYFKLKGSDSL